MRPEQVTEVMHDPLARELLHSAIPARMAYDGTDGNPRVIPVGYRTGAKRPSPGPMGMVYAGCCIRTSENPHSTQSGEYRLREGPRTSSLCVALSLPHCRSYCSIGFSHHACREKQINEKPDP